MLIQCKECEQQISSFAIACPHCGFPITKSKYKSRTRSKHMRLPNGFGSITELKGQKLNNPFRVRITTGFTDQGKPIRALLKPRAYFATYNDAYAALLKYNNDPYSLDKMLTIEELYNRWSEIYLQKLSAESSKRTVRNAWNYCSSVKGLQARELRARHIKCCMDQAPTAILKSRVKSLFNLMLDYALEYELVDKNYARSFNMSDEIITEVTTVKNEHISFTQEEMHILWQNITNTYVRLILIQCYMGWRPQELCLIETANVNIQEQTIIGGMKTEAGTNRTVPIHPYVLSFVSDLYNQASFIGSKYLVNENGNQLSYDKYKRRFAKVMKQLNITAPHRPHDCRKQFVTMAKKYNVDEYAIKKMVGHAIHDITEKTYTDRDAKWLFDELCKIKKES